MRDYSLVFFQNGLAQLVRELVFKDDFEAVATAEQYVAAGGLHAELRQGRRLVRVYPLTKAAPAT